MLWLSGSDSELVRADQITRIRVRQNREAATSSWSLTCTRSDGTTFCVYSAAGELSNAETSDVTLALARELHLEHSAGRAGVLFVLPRHPDDQLVGQLPVRFTFESWNDSPFPS